MKLFVANDSADLRVAIDRLASVGVHGLVFEISPGPTTRSYVYCVYLDGRGEPSPGVTVRKLRQNPPFVGGARVAKWCDEIPVLRDTTVALLRRRAAITEWPLPSSSVDVRTGRFIFIEVNGRPVLFNSILPPTGVDLVAMAWADVVLGQPLAVQPTAWRGAWIHLQADVSGSDSLPPSRAVELAECGWRRTDRPRCSRCGRARTRGLFAIQTRLAARRRPWPADAKRDCDRAMTFRNLAAALAPS